MTNRIVPSLTAAVICTLLMLSGCSGRVAEKEPNELFSLAVSGLSGIDRYTFSGTSGATTPSNVKVSGVSFSGKVEGHKRIRMQSNEATVDAARTVGDPLAYLKQMQLEATRITALPGESDNKVTVLQIETSSDSARKRWKKQLMQDFDQAVAGQDKQIGQQAAGGKTKSALSEELQAEVVRSRQQFNQLLQTLQVKTVCKLTIERKRLLPIKLLEHTTLIYEADGNQQQEAHQLEMRIMPAPDR
ncbi:hypothetical protein FHS18_006556 [Paenibacillus phyllosphaerae]|uniref:Uncharacterized protein n=1 Tax=Paenibacillus phyllosphaerae TaxID=274593 RepID=A0A7W5B4T6_9BACL|nr:hypothetical protein [Paenibacillus phyllosphaerae]MBB3114435.1 hypothetical protein [Paenibacillus phyllosphaerae]